MVLLTSLSPPITVSIVREVEASPETGRTPEDKPQGMFTRWNPRSSGGRRSPNRWSGDGPRRPQGCSGPVPDAGSSDTALGSVRPDLPGVWPRGARAASVVRLLGAAPRPGSAAVVGAKVRSSQPRPSSPVRAEGVGCLKVRSRMSEGARSTPCSACGSPNGGTTQYQALGRGYPLEPTLMRTWHCWVCGLEQGPTILRVERHRLAS